MNIASKLVRLERRATKVGLYTCPHCRGWPYAVIQEWLPNPDRPFLGRLRDPLSDSDKQAFVGWRDDDTWPVADLRCRWCGTAANVVILMRPGNGRILGDPAANELLPSERLVTDNPAGWNGIGPQL